MGLLWWLSVKEAACQCRRHGFDPWSGKIPHAAEPQSLRATTALEPRNPIAITEPPAATTEACCALELELCKEKPLQWEGHTQPPLATTREKPTQQGRCSTAKKLKIIIKNRDFPGGPVAKAPCSQRRGPRVRSLIREVDPTCCN